MTNQIDDDDFEERFEEFCAMSEAEVDAALEREMAAYDKWYDSLTPLQQYRHSRRLAVENCRGWRKLTRENPWMSGEYWNRQQRDRQIRLVKLRIWRVTGVYPGSG